MTEIPWKTPKFIYNPMIGFLAVLPGFNNSIALLTTNYT